MSSLRIVYAPRDDATPEGELDALANVYAYILRIAQEKKKAGLAGPAESKNPKRHERSSSSMIPKAEPRSIGEFVP
jgi:hypothetical protein